MTLLLIREEIVCCAILVFLISYNVFYNGINKQNQFIQIAIPGFAHIVMDLITVITVNNMDVVPEWMNRFLHIVYYITGILFIKSFFHYVTVLTLPNRTKQILGYVAYIPLVIFLGLTLVLPMEYVEGNDTNYSFGPLVFAGYGIFALFCLSGLAIMLIYGRKLELKARLSVIPMMILMFSMILTQAFIPELLMTGGGVTMVCIGLFIYMDNRLEKYMEEAYWDSTLGIRNRNGFNKEMSDIDKKFFRKNRSVNVGFIVCDMNGLKLVNDTIGHTEGDRLLAAAAEVLSDNLTGAQSVYRIGGDEFAAIYISPNEENVLSEIENVRKACAEYKGLSIELSIAIGYASGVYSDKWKEIYDKADNLMYQNKLEIKKQHPELARK